MPSICCDTMCVFRRRKSKPLNRGAAGEIERYANDGVVKMLIGNKSDLEEQRMVDIETAEVCKSLALLPRPLRAHGRVCVCWRRRAASKTVVPDRSGGLSIRV